VAAARRLGLELVVVSLTPRNQRGRHAVGTRVVRQATRTGSMIDARSLARNLIAPDATCR